MFRYFDNKDQLLFADHQRRTVALADALRGPGELTVHSLCDAVLEFFSVDVPRSADRIRLQLRVASDHWPAGALMFQHQSELVDVVATELRRRGLARALEAQMIASGVLVAVREMSISWLRDGETDLTDQLRDVKDRLRSLGPVLAAP